MIRKLSTIFLVSIIVIFTTSGVSAVVINDYSQKHRSHWIIEQAFTEFTQLENIDSLTVENSIYANTSISTNLLEDSRDFQIYDIEEVVVSDDVIKENVIHFLETEELANLIHKNEYTLHDNEDSLYWLVQLEDEPMLDQHLNETFSEWLLQNYIESEGETGKITVHSKDSELKGTYNFLVNAEDFSIEHVSIDIDGDISFELTVENEVLEDTVILATTLNEDINNIVHMTTEDISISIETIE